MTPDTADAYQHRVGRAGPGSSASWRVDRTGEALTLAQPAIRPMPSGRYPLTLEDEPIVPQIERLLGMSFQGHWPVGQRRRLAEFNYEGFNPEARPQSGNGEVHRPAAQGRQPIGQRHRPDGQSHRPAGQGQGSRARRHRSATQGRRPAGGGHRPPGRGAKRS
jgi:superfamily II DNA/RNA helicase